ncbi:MAG: phosphoribosylformylglycinamidine synthase subunit PurL, partial [Chloroflexia bacterium]|nr:phosphoribosylformylglycinamidine synthase subunit PurL [Chloroflexia bacterium]
ANLDAKAARCLAERLAHPVVEQVAVYRSDAPPADRWSRAFMPSAATNRTVETVLIVGLDDDALVALSRVRLLALPLEDLRAVQEHFAACGRDPTDVELETIAQTWSEHCAHRTFKATIRHREPGAEEVEIRGLLKTFIVAATETVDRPWVRSAFTDNAGIVAFDRRHDLSFKVETHNHPSAIEPFGGANTGVGGVVRDILGVSADPIANTDILCFGPPGPPPADLPPGALPPDRVRAGVVAGIADYGNKMGIPTVNGAVLFDPGYAANPLVFCGTVGLAPRDANPTLSQPGDLVVTAGGRVGRDGIHGATFSSEVIEAGTTAGLGSVVQIGDPIVEKRLADALPLVRDLGLYSAITDCGAGGLSSAVGEMASELGAEIELSTVPLKYAGLRPWEIWLSEAQERLVFAVPPAHWERFAAVMAAEGVEATAIGRFTGESRLVVRSAGQVVADLDCRFLHAGMPVRQLRSEWSGPPPETLAPPPPIETGADLTPWLERLLVNPNVASKESIVRRYDHEVQGRTVGKPFVGPLDLGPADAAVLRPVATSRRGVAVGCGINPRFGLIDPYAMAMLAVDEALRNVVAVGADPNRTAILDNFCWGDPTQPDRLGGLVRAARGCHDAAVGFRVPFVSGKDSLFNEYRDAAGVSRPIPGTLLISALGIVPDVCRAVSMELKAPGNLLYLVGETADDLGGSLFWHLQGRLGATAPVVRPRAGRALFNALHRTIRAGLVRACHDLSEGGLAVAAAEMAIASGFGVEIDRDLDRTRDRDESPQGFAGESSASAGKLPLSRAPGEGVGGEGSPTATTRPATALGPRRARTGGAAPSDEAWLFAESPTRFLIEVARDDAEAFERSLGRQPTIRIGRVTEEPRLRIHGDAGLVVNADVDDLRRIWREPLMGASA